MCRSKSLKYIHNKKRTCNHHFKAIFKQIFKKHKTIPLVELYLDFPLQICKNMCF